MGKADELDPVLRRAIDTAIIEYGAVLIYQEDGVLWDEPLQRWWWNRDIFRSGPHCSALAAFLLTIQPSPLPHCNECEVATAASNALQISPAWVLDLENGFDDFVYHGQFPDAYDLGVCLRKHYRPLSFDLMAINHCAGIYVSEEYMEYLRVWHSPDTLTDWGFPPDKRSSANNVATTPEFQTMRLAWAKWLHEHRPATDDTYEAEDLPSESESGTFLVVDELANDKSALPVAAFG